LRVFDICQSIPLSHPSYLTTTIIVKMRERIHETGKRPPSVGFSVARKRMFFLDFQSAKFPTNTVGSTQMRIMRPLACAATKFLGSNQSPSSEKMAMYLFASCEMRILSQSTARLSSELAQKSDKLEFKEKKLGQ
jgi:hypothetical protein